DFKPWEYWSLHPATRGVTPAGYCLTPEFFGWIDSQWNPSQTQFVKVYITAYWLTSHSNDLAAYNAYVSASGHTPDGLIISGTLPSASTGTTGTTNTGASTGTTATTTDNNWATMDLQIQQVLGALSEQAASLSAIGTEVVSSNPATSVSPTTANLGANLSTQPTQPASTSTSTLLWAAGGGVAFLLLRKLL
ncbi:MAG TPA: hypothetical protein VMQ76_10750, partial [Terracidiphilus sp.]|nr:hypothetical protein [Terracidiphilus sp.]